VAEGAPPSDPLDLIEWATEVEPAGRPDEIEPIAQPDLPVRPRGQLARRPRALRKWLRPPDGLGRGAAGRARDGGQWSCSPNGSGESAAA
jgi:hypothetical protein